MLKYLLHTLPNKPLNVLLAQDPLEIICRIMKNFAMMCYEFGGGYHSTPNHYEKYIQNGSWLVKIHKIVIAI